MDKREMARAARVKERVRRVVILLLVLLVAAVALGMWFAIPYVYGLSGQRSFEFWDGAAQSPLTGYAYPAWNTATLAMDPQLVYIDVTWAEWEPQEGIYDITGLETRNNIPFWKENGKHAVLRFVCDRPGSESHMDIPQWLFNQTGDGAFYDNSYGKGYSPAYDNPVFLEAHRAALAALGSYCSHDTFFSYVELGSLGHWGEWHVFPDEGLPPMPDVETCWEYAGQYSDSFVNAKLLMRRPYVMAAEGGMGVYNDMAGDEAATAEWLEWQRSGGEYSYAGNVIPYQAVEEIWNTAPVGGEFTSGIPMDQLLGSRLQTTLSLLEQSHMTFIGPKAPSESEMELPGAKEALKRLGYHLWISNLDVRIHFFQGVFRLELTWENNGAAPLYFDWPVMMYVYDNQGELRYWDSVDVDLTQVYPGEKVISTSEIPFNDIFRQGYTVGIAILDPMTEDPAMQLSMDIPYQDGINYIYTYQGS